MAALAAFAVWEEWLNLGSLGLTLVVSPWVLGFQNSDGMTLHVVIGTIVAALGGFRGMAHLPRASDRSSGVAELAFHQGSLS